MNLFMHDRHAEKLSDNHMLSAEKLEVLPNNMELGLHSSPGLFDNNRKGNWQYPLDIRTFQVELSATLEDKRPGKNDDESVRGFGYGK